MGPVLFQEELGLWKVCQVRKEMCAWIADNEGAVYVPSGVIGKQSLLSWIEFQVTIS